MDLGNHTEVGPGLPALPPVVGNLSFSSELLSLTDCYSSRARAKATPAHNAQGKRPLVRASTLPIPSGAHQRGSPAGAASGGSEALAGAAADGAKRPEGMPILTSPRVAAGNPIGVTALLQGLCEASAQQSGFHKVFGLFCTRFFANCDSLRQLPGNAAMWAQLSWP